MEEGPFGASGVDRGDDLAGQADAVRDVTEPGADKESAPAPGAGSADDEALARCKAEMEELRLRNAAEMENFKKRLTREHQEQMRFAAERVLGDLLPSLDNLDLALQYGSQHEACKDMLQGVSMTRKLLLDALEKNGLKALGEVGDEFNPEVHEAVGFEPNPELAPGSVTRVMQRGYKLNDRLLRAAKVMINQ
ncbi:MAG: nucleotide exchange factor GrpE [Desulfovibrio sp.]|nr:nucleotide exchange factor GrpE [Desulfovibrio sp.]